MRRKLFTLFTAAVGIASIASMAKAATVNYWIVTTADPHTATSGNWQVYADVSTGDNDGLAQAEFDIVATGGVSIGTASFNLAPSSPSGIDHGDPSFQYQGATTMGFNSGFNSTGTRVGTGVANSRTGVIVGQSTIYSGGDNPAIDMGIFVGVGQENATASPQNGSQGPIDGSGTTTGLANNLWTYVPATTLFTGDPLIYQQQQAGTLIAQGNYTDAGLTGGTLTVVADAAEVLGTGETIPPGGASFPGTYGTGSNQLWGYDPYQLGDTPFVTNGVNGSGVGSSINIGNVPEPASIGLLVLGMGMIGGGRKMRRKSA
jgi:hypothetical protein